MHSDFPSAHNSNFHVCMKTEPEQKYKRCMLHVCVLKLLEVCHRAAVAVKPLFSHQSRPVAKPSSHLYHRAQH